MTNHNDMGIDLLLGVGRSLEVSSPGSSQENIADGSPLFADLLGNMLMSWPGGARRPLVAGDAENITQPAATTASMSTATSEIPFLSAETSFADEDALPVTSEHVGRSAFESAPGAIDRNIVAFKNDILAELPVSSLVSKVSSRPAVDGIVADLPSGRCEIISSIVSDGNLYLTLTGPDQDGAPIQVRIPVELLTDAAERQAATNRVDLGVNAKQAPSLEQLLARLNVKYLEVSQNGFDDVETGGPVKIVLSGEDNGREISLDGRLSRDNYHGLAVGNQSSLGEAQASVKDPAGEIARASRQGEPQPKQPVAEPTTESTRTIQAGPGHDVRLATGRMNAPLVINESTDPSLTCTINGVDSAARGAGAIDVKLSRPLVKMAGGTTEQFAFGNEQQSGDPFIGLDSWAGNNRIDRKDIAPRTIRFSLPDDLQTKLTPNGQSISIRIEPEHLGPARLSLTISHDKLRARVTVESFEVKALVERSLDRLTQQLTRAGVEVDKIEVTVDGRQSGNGLLERHAQWRRPAMSPAFSNNIESEFNQADTTRLMVPTGHSYVGAGGVNVLA